MKRLYFRPSGVSRRALALIAALAACLLFAVEKLPVQQKQANYDQKVAAAALASEAMRTIRDERLARDLRIDAEIDPAGSGLIGTAYSPVTSNTGDLTSKRTANNPNFAAVLVQMLRESGVRRGDQVAVGVSGSFPGLNVAAYAAMQTLEAKPLIIVSASASEFGANLPELLWLDMEKLLVDKGVFRFRAPAASRGGIDDRGYGMPEQGQALLDAAIQRHGLRKVDAESLADAIDLRMQVYGELAQNKPIRAYLNIGGGSASVGTYVGKKQLKPGVNMTPPRGATPVDSVMQRFLQRGVPVVHITQIVSLARRYGLPVDPKVTPKPGEGSVYVKTTYNRWLALAGVVIILLAMIAFTRLDLGLRLLGTSRRAEDRPEPQQMIESVSWKRRVRKEATRKGVDADHGGWFVPTSVAKVVAFGVIGGWLYCAFWMYRNWQAYRRDWGYSREPFWRAVNAATGYRISPFWRAALAGGYVFCLFPAVHRECRHNGVRGVAAPIVLAILFQVLVLSSQQQPAAVRLLLSPIWVIVPVQLAINRLNWSVRREAPFGLDGLEVLCVALGGLWRWL